MSRKVTVEQHRDRALRAGSILVAIEGRYCTLSCAKHGGEYRQHASHILAGKTGCKKCISEKMSEVANRQANIKRMQSLGKAVASARIVSDETAKSRLAKSGLELVSRTPTSKGRWTAKCPLHDKTFTAVGAQLLRGFNNCPECVITRARMNAMKGSIVSAGNKKLGLDELNGRAPEGVTIIDYKSSMEDKTLECNTCKTQWTTKSSRVLYGNANCPKCKPKGTSMEEIQVFEFIASICPDAINGHRMGNGKEIDIFIPSRNIGIEYNGLYWHSERRREKGHIEKKREEANTLGIRLVQIYSDEWLNQRDLIEKYLKNTLGIFSDKISARDCIARPVKMSEAREFCNLNHLQGFFGVKPIGLFHGGVLVAVATQGAYKGSRRNELARWCVAPGILIRGGLGKVLAQMPEVKFTFCDLGKFTGDGYIGAGWKLASLSRPQYWYTDNNERRSRIGFQKHKLLAIPGATGNTEKELAASIGWHPIAGCRQAKFIRP